MKTCTKCKQEKEDFEFNRSNYTTDRLQSWCRECKRHRPEQTFKDHLWRRHGMSEIDYEIMLKSQDGVCAICGQLETIKRNGTIQQLSVDHDHKTGITRELLCHQCNIVLGNAKDDPEILEKGAAYLRKHRKRIEKVKHREQRSVQRNPDSNSSPSPDT